MKSYLSLFLALVFSAAVSAYETSDFTEQVTLIEEHDQNERHLCSPSVRPIKSNFGVGEQIVAIVTVCGGGVEWMGMYSPSAGVFDNAVNWQYTCGGQTCAVPMMANTYAYGFGPWSGMWPLGGTYKFQYHSTAGSVSSATFTVGGNSGNAVPPATGSRAPRYLRAPEEEVDFAPLN
ncbi:unnamed protein product [Cylindrotheca closterium]|uniref:Uncharacterized protein n=1 Tax=Cylindrotheca closterium TaxID=2856 RepID=A0AAD2CSY3_9STRA|nr:unnamed protein product [Cylindrotheca closterium]